ncbi:hypothetical protein Tco_0072928 [Tanacetum coccineum]
MYLMCLNRKIKYQETGILKLLIIFIRSSVIWERVHDYPLGLESYQLKINLTAPKLTFPGIKEKKPYSITSLPFVGLIYENIKKEKRIMDIDEILKFCDETLKRVLKEVKKIDLDVKHGYADLTLSKDDAEFMVDMVASPANNSIGSVLNRVILATTVDYIWQERNRRVFTQEKRDEQIMINTITDNIRMQLISFRVKNSIQIKKVEDS